MGGCAGNSNPKDSYRGRSYDGRSNSYDVGFSDLKHKKSPSRRREGRHKDKKLDEGDRQGNLGVKTKKTEYSNGVLDMRLKSQIKAPRNSSRTNTPPIDASRSPMRHQSDVKDIPPKPELIRFESQRPQIKQERPTSPRMNKTSLNSNLNTNVDRSRKESVPELHVFKPTESITPKPSPQNNRLTIEIPQKKSPQFQTLRDSHAVPPTIPPPTSPIFVPLQPQGISKEVNVMAIANLGQSVTHADLMNRKNSSTVSTSGNFHPITNGQMPILSPPPKESQPIPPGIPPPLPLPFNATQIPPLLPHASMIQSHMISSGFRGPHPPPKPSSYLSQSIIMNLKLDMDDDPKTMDLQRFDYTRRLPF